jgi:hypothetical protein
MEVNGTVQLEPMDGKEIKGVVLIGEPTPIVGTNKLRCLANVDGALALVELSIKFVAKPVATQSVATVESAAS